MADLMTFPDTVEEFMDQYKITDTEQIYTNGIELVPIFRMKQWFEHYSERKKGKWKLNREGNWACPFCEFDPYHDEMNGMNYCPNCGARLEGFDNGEIH